jgi:hypothetical protein
MLGLVDRAARGGLAVQRQAGGPFLACSPLSARFPAIKRIGPDIVGQGIAAPAATPCAPAQAAQDGFGARPPVTGIPGPVIRLPPDAGGAGAGILDPEAVGVRSGHGAISGFVRVGALDFPHPPPGQSLEGKRFEF